MMRWVMTIALVLACVAVGSAQLGAKWPQCSVCGETFPRECLFVIDGKPVCIGCAHANLKTDMDETLAVATDKAKDPRLTVRERELWEAIHKQQRQIDLLERSIHLLRNQAGLPGGDGTEVQ